MINVKVVVLLGGAMATELLAPGTVNVGNEAGSDRLTLVAVGTTPTNTAMASVASNTVCCTVVCDDSLSLLVVRMSCETKDESKSVTLARLDCGACSSIVSCDVVELLNTISIRENVG